MGLLAAEYADFLQYFIFAVLAPPLEHTAMVPGVTSYHVCCPFDIFVLIYEAWSFCISRLSTKNHRVQTRLLYQVRALSGSIENSAA